MIDALYVMVGGGLGAVLRFFVSEFLNKKFNLKHWATFWVNFSGCFLLGFCFTFVSKFNPNVSPFLIIGLIGSYTTFSTFEYENIHLIAHEKYFEFLKYSFLSCLFCFISLTSGYAFAKLIINLI